jgi:hypothetical protein
MPGILGQKSQKAGELALRNDMPRSASLLALMPRRPQTYMCSVRDETHSFKSEVTALYIHPVQRAGLQ